MGVKMPFTYKATLNVDYTGREFTNEITRLKNALVQAGWRWVETSAFVIETDNLGLVWRGIDLVARQTAAVGGHLSALTFHIQGSKNFDGLPSGKPGNAMKTILTRPFPQP
jgi:hypothetical protein